MTSPPFRKAEWWEARDEPLMRHGTAWRACGMGAGVLGMAMEDSARQKHQALLMYGLWEHDCLLCPLCRGCRIEQPRMGLA